MDDDFAQVFLRTAKSWDGSELVASEKFLNLIAPSLRKANYLVDFGAGIGTVSAFALKINASISVLAVEENEWCRSQFWKNVGGVTHRNLKLVESLRSVTQQEMPNKAIWVIDTEQSSSDIERICESSFESIWIEGHRLRQRIQVLRTSLRHGVDVSYRSFLGGPRSAKGGCVIDHKGSSLTLDRRLLTWLQITRIYLVLFLKLHIIEWELWSRLDNATKKLT